MFNAFRRPAGIFACALGLLLVMTQAKAALMLEIVDTIPGIFTDISGTGAALGIGDDLAIDLSPPTTVGNLVFGAGDVRVGSNGGVRFDGDGEDLLLGPGFDPEPIPSTLSFDGDQTLLPFWQDINTETVGPDSGGEIFWQEIAGTLIIQWDKVRFFDSDYNDPDDIATFQIKVFGSETPAFAQFIYQDIEGGTADEGNFASIGYQDGKAGFNDVQWSFDEKSVSNGTVLSLVASPVLEPIPVPEPATYALMGLGLAGFGYRLHRNKIAA